MKKLTSDEFNDRVMALQRVYHIFLDTGLTDNITNAFAAYQAIFAERERQIFIISDEEQASLSQTISRMYERPKCPDCNSEMQFRPTEDDKIKTQLVCSNASCDTVLNSENDLNWWMQQLPHKPLKEKDEYERPVKGSPANEQKRRRARYVTKDTRRRVRLMRRRDEGV